MNHIWTQIGYSSLHETHLKNQRVTFVKKGEKKLLLGEIGKCNLKKRKEEVETARWEPPEDSIAWDIHSISKAGYVTAALAILLAELSDWEANSFCDILNITSCDFTLFF